MITNINEFKLMLESANIDPNFEITEEPVGYLEDQNEIRPARMANPITLSIKGNLGNNYIYSDTPKEHYRTNIYIVNTSGGQFHSGGIYIQDDLNDMLIDKYGKENGDKSFEYALDLPSHGAFYQIGMKIAAEKSIMVMFLQKDLEKYIENNKHLKYTKFSILENYNEVSYFWLWKQMMKKLGKDVDKSIQTGHNKKAVLDAKKAAAEKAKQDALLAAQQAKQDKKNADEAELRKVLANIKVTQKDVDRINSMVNKPGSNKYLASLMVDTIKDNTKLLQRGKAAEEAGYNDIADVFYDAWKTRNL